MHDVVRGAVRVQCCTPYASLAGAPVARVLTRITAAFRRSPRSFARFIGEFLNAALNSACDICTRSRANVRTSLPARTGRAPNARSVSCSENFTFHGQQVWEMCRYTRFEIALATGGGALNRASA